MIFIFTSVHCIGQPKTWPETRMKIKFNPNFFNVNFSTYTIQSIPATICDFVDISTSNLVTIFCRQFGHTVLYGDGPTTAAIVYTPKIY